MKNQVFIFELCGNQKRGPFLNYIFETGFFSCTKGIPFLSPEKRDPRRARILNYIFEKIIFFLRDGGPFFLGYGPLLLCEELKGSWYGGEVQEILKNRFLIEVIRKRTIDKGEQEVLVKWKGWPEKFNTWIPASDLERVK